MTPAKEVSQLYNLLLAIETSSKYALDFKRLVSEARQLLFCAMQKQDEVGLRASEAVHLLELWGEAVPTSIMLANAGWQREADQVRREANARFAEKRPGCH